MLSLAPLRALTKLLTDAGIRTTEDPAELVPPGVIIRPSSFQALTLASWEVRVELLLVVPSSDPARSADELVALANAVLELVEPDGPIVARPIVLPNDPALLPGLVVPVYLT